MNDGLDALRENLSGVGEVLNSQIPHGERLAR